MRRPGLFSAVAAAIAVLTVVPACQTSGGPSADPSDTPEGSEITLDRLEDLADEARKTVARTAAEVTIETCVCEHPPTPGHLQTEPTRHTHSTEHGVTDGSGTRFAFHSTNVVRSSTLEHAPDDATPEQGEPPFTRYRLVGDDDAGEHVCAGFRPDKQHLYVLRGRVYGCDFMGRGIPARGMFSLAKRFGGTLETVHEDGQELLEVTWSCWTRTPSTGCGEGKIATTKGNSICR